MRLFSPSRFLVWKIIPFLISASQHPEDVLDNPGQNVGMTKQDAVPTRKPRYGKWLRKPTI